MGEHAAVYGFPAIVATLDRRVHVEVSSRPAGSGVDLEIAAAGIRRSMTWFEVNRWTDAARRGWERWSKDASQPFPQPELGGVGAVILALGESARSLGEAHPEAIHIRVESDLPIGSGFGSSAALAVAVAAAYLAARGVEPSVRRVGSIALECERRVHGRPSGIDHESILRGGIIWVQRGGHELELTVLNVGEERLSGVKVFDTGRPRESTGEVVAAVRRKAQSGGAAFQKLLQTMAGATLDFRRALENGETDLRPAMREFERGLELIGAVPGKVRKAIRRIESEGGAAKISGAGALTGDHAGCLLVCGRSEAVSAELPEAQVVPVEWGGRGLRVEENP